MNDIITRRRLLDFPDQIQELSRNNPIIYKCIQDYAHGRIITRDECLAQMIIMLAHDWGEQEERNYKLAMSVMEWPKEMK